MAQERSAPPSSARRTDAGSGSRRQASHNRAAVRSVTAAGVAPSVAHGLIIAVPPTRARRLPLACLEGLAIATRLRPRLVNSATTVFASPPGLSG